LQALLNPQQQALLRILEGILLSAQSIQFLKVRAKGTFNKDG